LPHDLVTGRPTTLKAVACSQRLPLSYTWNFGDGSAPGSGIATTAAEINAIQATHAYVGPEGKPFIATVTVEDADGNVATAHYRMRIRAPIIEVDANIAIDEGMWYLHREMVRSTIAKGTWGNWTIPVGNCANGNNAVNLCIAAGRGQVFQVNGHLPAGDPRVDPYVEDAWRVLLRLNSNLKTLDLEPQTFGAADTDANGTGVDSDAGSKGYELGPVMDALVALSSPNAHAPVGPAGVGHRRWGSVIHDMADTIFWGQTDDPGVKGGGWRYGWNAQEQDNSAAQWSALGLWPPEKLLGIRTPDWVRAQLRRWLDYSNTSGFFGYIMGAPSFDPRLAPSGMMQLAFTGAVGLDDPATPEDERDPLLALDEDYIAAHWSDSKTWYKPANPLGPCTTYGY